MAGPVAVRRRFVSWHDGDATLVISVSVNDALCENLSGAHKALLLDVLAWGVCCKTG